MSFFILTINVRIFKFYVKIEKSLVNYIYGVNNLIIMVMIKINFVGKSTYSHSKFSIEAKKYGVSRGMPYRIARTLNFGDKIYLATWNYSDTVPDLERRGLKRIGTATIFGYFIINGLNTDNDVVSRIQDKLDVVSQYDMEGVKIIRGCGSYDLGICCIVTNTLQECCDLIHEEEPKTKIFLAGKFVAINPKVIIENIKFSRTLLKYETPERNNSLTNTPDNSDENTISGISDYERKQYYSKAEKEAEKTNTLDKFF